MSNQHGEVTSWFEKFIQHLWYGLRGVNGKFVTNSFKLHRMNKTKNKTKKWIIFLVIILLMPIILYGALFNNLVISNNPSDWTLFAEYFTGLLNPVFLLINIVVLIKLTYEVAEYNKKNILSRMKYSALSLITSKLFSLTKIILIADDKEKEIQLLRNDINSFCNANNSLFSEIDLAQYGSKFDSILNRWLDGEDPSQILDQFDEIRNKVIQDIQNSIIN